MKPRFQNGNDTAPEGVRPGGKPFLRARTKNTEGSTLARAGRLVGLYFANTYPGENNPPRSARYVTQPSTRLSSPFPRLFRVPEAAINLYRSIFLPSNRYHRTRSISFSRQKPIYIYIYISDLRHVYTRTGVTIRSKVVWEFQADRESRSDESPAGNATPE